MLAGGPPSWMVRARFEVHNSVDTRPTHLRLPMTATDPDLAALTARIRRFAAERDWEQFHTPKNLTMALAAEVGELIEQFQWLTDAQSSELTPAQRTAVSDEIADVFIYLVRLCDVVGVDLHRAALAKIEINEGRYPAERVRGSAKKYSDYS